MMEFREKSFTELTNEELCGFVVSSGEFLEDGIPHVEMTYTF